MRKIKLELTEKDIIDLSQGLIFAMKELEKYKQGSDRKLADRLDLLLNFIRKEAGEVTSKDPG
ncbi:hypothetical protein AAKU52_002588 [Pedobacter sp. CG_S7]|uniref:hypothetical protein n=1 Tax=Pedobacter sp. CG_S7 TaxID=3143930 RepID=UPI00339464FA